MGLKNTKTTFGSVAKWIHWISAICFLVAYATYYYGHWFTEPRTDERFQIIGLHAMFGLTVLLLVFPRLIWLFLNVQPDADPASKWQYLTARCVRWALYLLILLVPLTGWLGFGAEAVNFFGFFEIPTFRTSGFFELPTVMEMGLTFEVWEEPIDYIHKKILGEWLAWMLIVVHVGAAFYHHFVQRDNTLRRMLPGRW